jgi:hypothetical protein
MNALPISEFKFNKFSQYGEDGVIKEILRRISAVSTLDQWCCEFGAWDGLHLSNTARLILEDDYKGVLIEGDPKRVEELGINFPGNKIQKICSFVTHSGDTSLDRILQGTEIPVDFDFLSIDIDGMDYWILDSLQIYKPKLICIEFNPSIPNSVHFVQEKNTNVKHGSSAKAIAELAVDKGYRLVAATQCNLLLVRSDFAKDVILVLPTIEEVVPLGNDPQYIFCGYDGTILSNKQFIQLGWHETFPLTKIQVLPIFLRKYSGDYNVIESKLFHLYHFLSRENRVRFLIKKIQRRSLRLLSNFKSN